MAADSAAGGTRSWRSQPCLAILIAAITVVGGCASPGPDPAGTRAAIAIRPTPTVTAAPVGTTGVAPTAEPRDAIASPVPQPPATPIIIQPPVAQGLPPPYPVPASCPAMPLVGPQPRKGFPAYWLDGKNLAAGTPIGVLFEGGNKVQWHAEHKGKLTIAGQRLDGPAPPLETRIVAIDLSDRNAPDFGSIFSSETTFRAPGCWRIQAAAGDQALDTTVYVYPWSCRPDGMRGRDYQPAAPAPCAPPTG